MTITRDQIRGLRNESAQRGDLVTTHACDMVLYGESSVPWQSLTMPARNWSRAEALAECVRIIELAEFDARRR